MRFRAEQHLRRQRDIRSVREQGRRLDCGAFTMWYLRRPACVPSEKSLSQEPAGPELPPSENVAQPNAPTAQTSSRPPRMDKPVPADLRRVCVVASTAAVGNAVARARAKRRLRELFRNHQDTVPPGYDLLLIARQSINRLEYREIERKFVEACPRIATRSA